jgi:hypothetical protein
LILSVHILLTLSRKCVQEERTSGMMLGWQVKWFSAHCAGIIQRRHIQDGRPLYGD